MTNMGHLLKVWAAWTTIVYLICFGGVALIPGVRPWFMHYALHMEMNRGGNMVTLDTFFAGLIIWNVVAVLAVCLFAFLYDKFRPEA